MRNIVLSERMEAVAGMVDAGDLTVADVGCDHAYVSIALVNRKLASKAIAMDVKKGPLEIAANNIKEQELEEKIELRLGDGIKPLLPSEADVIIIAGMGGLLVTRILKEGINILENDAKAPCLVLQPQSEIREVRHFLLSHNYYIEDEKMVEEDGKYYTVIKALPKAMEREYSETELTYGRINLEKKDKVLYDYLVKEKHTLEEILRRMNENLDESKFKDRKRQRMTEVKKELEINSMAMGCFGEG